MLCVVSDSLPMVRASSVSVLSRWTLIVGFIQEHHICLSIYPVMSYEAFPWELNRNLSKKEKCDMVKAVDGTYQDGSQRV